MGSEATTEDARGAIALLNANRASRVLNTMNEQEEAKCGVDARKTYFKVGDGKMNLAPSSETAKWFHLISANLGNGPVDDPFEKGDKIAVVTEWQWPDPPKTR